MAFLLEFLRIEQTAHMQIGAVPNVAVAILHTVLEPSLLGRIEAEFCFAKSDFFREESDERASE